MIKTLTKYKIVKPCLLLNVIFLFLSLCIVNSSFAAEKEAEDFPWELFYPAFIKKTSNLEGNITFDTCGLQGVEVRLNGRITTSTITDKNGHYSLVNLPPGKYTIQPVFRGLTFDPPLKEVILQPNSRLSLDFKAQANVLYHVFFVSTNGDDTRSGKYPTACDSSDKGPLATLPGAKNLLGEMIESGSMGKPVLVYLRGGKYFQTAPITFSPGDSGTQNAPITYLAYPYEKPIFSGGKIIKNWQEVNGKWQTEIVEYAEKPSRLGALWVNGVRRPAAVQPNDGYFYTAGKAEPVNQAFQFQPGDIQNWTNVDDVIVEVFHSWATSLHRIESIDFENHIVMFTAPAFWGFEDLGPGQRYRIHHVGDGLDREGEWYLDSNSGKITYFPLPGETLDSVEMIVPFSEQILKISGVPQAGEFVQYLNFEGLTFMHTNWHPGNLGSSTVQAAIEINGAIEVLGGRNIVFEKVRIGHIGTYGLWFRKGSQDCQLIESEIFDMGGGGVRIGDIWETEDPYQNAGSNKVENCFLHDGGNILSGAMGIWIGRSSNNQILHNEISDFDYTGISAGWFGSAASSANHNIIGHNHIHHIGRGILSDMGGVYTLGLSPGTEVTHNLIHDISSFSHGFGAFGLYPDATSSDILFKDNLVYKTASGSFYQNDAKDNIVTNNIFAFSHEAQIARWTEDDHQSFNLHHNIIIYNNALLLGYRWSNGNFKLSHNIYWDLVAQNALFNCLTYEEWEAAGNDSNSLVVDPQFRDALDLDFRLLPTSPAFELGFVAFDLESFGLYGDEDWVNLPHKIERDETPMPEYSPPEPFSDGFEITEVGKQPIDAIFYGETESATIRVTDEIAASGSQSLKFTDAPGLDYIFNPLMFYQPNLSEALISGSFKLNLGEGAVFLHEWRDISTPYVAGPSIYIASDGSLTATGKYLMQVPRNTWIAFEMIFQVGSLGDGLYDLTVTLPGAKPKTFRDLGTPGQTICGLHWLGFVANSNAVTSFYLDDVSLIPVE